MISRNMIAFFACLLLCLSSVCFDVSNSLLHCPNDTFYNTNSTSGRIFRHNLDFLLSALTSNASDHPNGFYNFTAESANVSSNDDDTAVYGLYLCRGDVTTSNCQDCLATARSEVLRLCPVVKTATIWYDHCMLRYSYQSIFSRVDTSITWFMWNPNYVNENDTALLNHVLGDTFDQIAVKAANGDVSGKKFAVEEANFTSFQRRIYALGQCTPDLTSLDCETCLRGAISNLPGCCKNRPGGRVINPSCNIRYETYPFFKVQLTPPPPSPTLPGPEGNGGSSTVLGDILTYGVLISLIILLFVGAARLAWRSKKGYHYQTLGTIELPPIVKLQHAFKEIEAATNNFCNKIGEGGFGPVYKGTLPDGKDIAVKRLSKSSRQGPAEFKSEIDSLSELQHRNLVRLLGYCLEGEEMLLVYEFVPNESLNYYLSDQGNKQELLDWSTRYKIIEGIARGILYLHEDSRHKIIHRDLKAGNVLLDQNMNPKIADFGMARLFDDGQYEEYTKKRAGTRGYMAPEYLTYGRFSTKSDMYSFGVLILEIVSGKKRSNFDREHAFGTDDFLNCAWRQWRDREPLKLVDPILGDSYERNEVVKAIGIGLLCVKHNSERRPTISSVLHLLNSQPISIDRDLILDGDSAILQAPVSPVVLVEQPQILQHTRIQDDAVEDRRGHFFNSVVGRMKQKRNLKP